MVKADAYGHGAVPVSRKLVECGVAALGVATIEEGLELRDAGIGAPILVMGGLMGMGDRATEAMVTSDLTPVVHSLDVIEPLETAARLFGRRVGLHLKVDTGMTRLGIRPEVLPRILERLASCTMLSVDGVMTHFAQADDAAYAAYQMEGFMRAKRTIELAVGPVKVWHAANSAALLSRVGLSIDGAAKTWARPGILLYGGMVSDHGICPVMSVESKLVLIKSVPAGTKVSYDCTFETARRSRLGMIPVGYADGYPRSLSNRSHVLVRGGRAPVVGRVTMDMVIVDVTDVPSAQVGDTAVLLGRQGDAEITSLDLAAWGDTNSYEILTGISARMPRVYRNE